jgi:hypothetical protein
MINKKCNTKKESEGRRYGDEGENKGFVRICDRESCGCARNRNQ